MTLRTRSIIGSAAAVAAFAVLSSGVAHATPAPGTAPGANPATTQHAQTAAGDDGALYNGEVCEDRILYVPPVVGPTPSETCGTADPPADYDADLVTATNESTDVKKAAIGILQFIEPEQQWIFQPVVVSKHHTKSFTVCGGTPIYIANMVPFTKRRIDFTIDSVAPENVNGC